MKIARWLFAMAVLAGLGLGGLWIGLLGDSSRIGGGIPFLPAGLNIMIARTVFVLGGLTCLALLAWGLRLGPDAGRRN